MPMFTLLRFSLVLTVLIVIPGCGPTIQSGSFEVDKGSYDKAVDAVAARAAFELSCPRQQLSFVVVATRKNNAGRHFVAQLGAAGCGNKAVYVKKDNQWILNSSTE